MEHLALDWSLVTDHLSLHLKCAVSSVVEHYLDTVGVRGSKPLPRTIFPNFRTHMQKLSLTLVLLLFATASLLQAQNRSSQYDQAQIIINTLSGPIRNAVVYAPRPIWPAVALQQHLSGRGVYAIGLDTGIPYDVRVVRSTGHKILDDAAVDALLKWRFRRVVTGVTIPIEFGWTKEPTKPPIH